jgi:diadenosine tetraphosphatase ApaH/serine/threonine PP2A family protein phosphatase
LKIAVISDIHANLEGLRAVLADIAVQGITSIYCLGDIVGYGPDVNECCALVRQHCGVSLLGNHDDAVLGRTSTAYFNAYAVEAIEYTRRVIRREHLAFLSSLPYTHITDTLYLVHSTPESERDWDYLSPANVHRNLPIVGDRVGMVGHAHLQGAFVWSEQRGDWTDLAGLAHLDREIALGDRGSIVVVGSVGQPRDNDPRAGYVILDPEHRVLRFKRVAYPVEKVQQRILDAGLPPFLAARLAQGY